MTPLEKDIEKALRRMIGRHGGLCIKWTSPSFGGVPDRICLLPGGHVIFVELKRPQGGERAKLQEWWSKTLKKMGFEHRWIKNHEELKALEIEVRVMTGEMKDGYV